MEFARHAEIPGVLEVNSPLVEEQAAHRTLVNRALAEQIRSHVFSEADTVVAVSNEIASHIRRVAGSQSRICVIPNGVDPGRFSTLTGRRAVGSDVDTYTVGFVGTFKPWHGVGHLIDAFNQIYHKDERCRLLMVGDGPERTHLEKALDLAGTRQAAHFAGSVAPGQVPDWISRMDVAVAPYPDHDNFYFSPLKIYEYMAAGKPVVASRVGQIGSLIEDGVNGLLVPPGNASALADALKRLADDQELRQHLGKEARSTICKSHTWDSVARRILELVELIWISQYQPVFSDQTGATA